MNNQAAQTMPIVDDFNGDNAKLINSARALISLSDSGSLAPHGIGGHARAILSAFIVRTEAAALAQPAGVVEAVRSYLMSNDLYSLLTDIQNGIDSPATMGTANSLIVRLDRLRDMLASAPAASGVDTSTNEAWAARAQEKIAAMDAASGGEAKPAFGKELPSSDEEAMYAAAGKGFHTSETSGTDGRYVHVIRFRSIEELHAYEHAWTAAMVKVRDSRD